MVIGRSLCLRRPGVKLPLPLTRDSLSSESCRLDLAEPLVALTGKDVPFVWRLQCAAAFLLLWDKRVRYYFSKWTEAFPIKDTCADTVADVLVNKIILRFGMPLVIHSDQGREFENGLMKSLCSLFGCVKTRTAPYHMESDGMVERFNRTCLMMLSMFVNDRRDNWHELLPFVMHDYWTSVHESTGYSLFRLMMGRIVLYHRISRQTICALTGKRTWRHTLLQCGYGTLWRLHTIMCVIHFIAQPPV